MTLADSGVTLHELLMWGFGLIGTGSGVLALRAKNSVDSMQRARNDAEAGIYNSALAEMTADRNGWRDSYRDLEKLFRASESQCARLMALQETHAHEMQTLKDQHASEIRFLQSQITNLQRMVSRLAPEEFRRTLGPDFARSQAGALDDTERNDR